jgi:hypothetical protein
VGSLLGARGGSGDHDLMGFPRMKAYAGGKSLVSDFELEYTIMVFPKTGNNFIFSPPTGGLPGHPGMNNKGVVRPHHGNSGIINEIMFMTTVLQQQLVTTTSIGLLIVRLKLKICAINT